MRRAPCSDYTPERDSGVRWPLRFSVIKIDEVLRHSGEDTSVSEFTARRLGH